MTTTTTITEALLARGREFESTSKQKLGRYWLFVTTNPMRQIRRGLVVSFFANSYFFSYFFFFVLILRSIYLSNNRQGGECHRSPI